jgi:cleavage and polyadenylation specificity factor subunit 2
MASIIRLCPISGGAGQETPHCYLLEVDQFTFLLDCGWDPTFSEELTRELKKYIHKIDAVLLSHPDNLHIGALPYAVGKLGLSCPIFATVPVYKMGQMFLYDLYQSRHNMEDFNLFTLDEVDRTFEMITQLKFNQTHHLTGKGAGLAVTPVAAGHMIGGAMWRIVKEGEEDIVYAVDYNHKRERHLNGADVEKIARPSLLITDAYNACYTQIRRRSRDEQLMTMILQTMRAGGNALVCVDTAGRVLELAHMVDLLWQNKESGLLTYSLALLNNVSYNVVEFAKSQIEWMSEKLMRTFEGKRNNPFTFRHLKLCHSIAEVNKVPSPKVVLASTTDMECGFSRELFALWSAKAENSIILTSRSTEGTLTYDLIKNGGNRVINLMTGKRVKLTGQELEDHKRKEKESKQKLDDPIADEESSSDEEMDIIKPVLAGATAKPVRHDIIMRPLAGVENDAEGRRRAFFKSTKSKFPMYPHYEEKIRWDDYGEIIRPEEWVDPTSSLINDPNDDSNGPSAMMGNIIDDGADLSEVPTKCVQQNLTIHIKAQIQFIDFEGRSDGESVMKLIQQVKPRRVIIVRGSISNCEAMAKVADTVTIEAGVGSNKRVFLPKTGEFVDATTESYIYQVITLIIIFNYSRFRVFSYLICFLRALKKQPY